MTPTRAAPPVALRARVAEFLLVGGITPLCFVVSWLLQRSVGLDAADLAVGFTMFHAAYIINDPHFSVTYLLFYEDFRARAFGSAFPRGLRLRYLFAGVVVPAALALWALSALVSGSAEQLGVLLQLMFVLVGWHYVKQGFGVMIVLCARRGLRFAPAERWIIVAHCFAGWAYSWANPHREARLDEVKGVVYAAIARPHWFELLALGAVVVTSALLIGMLLRKWRREGPLPLFTPLTALLCSIWLWLIYSNVDPLVRYVMPALHSLQYLYFVWLLRRNEAKSREAEPFFEAPTRERLTLLAVSALALGWLLFHGAPEALDEMFVGARRPRPGDGLGPTPYVAALYAFVNLHHYFMDHVIWRRDNPRTRFLMAPSSQPAPAARKKRT